MSVSLRDGTSRTYEQWAEPISRNVAAVVPAELGSANGRVLLDVATGHGGLTDPAAQKLAASPHARTAVMDATTLDTSEEGFDAVVSVFGASILVPGAPAAFRDMRRAVKADGAILEDAGIAVDRILTSEVEAPIPEPEIAVDELHAMYIDHPMYAALDGAVAHTALGKRSRR